MDLDKIELIESHEPLKQRPHTKRIPEDGLEPSPEPSGGYGELPREEIEGSLTTRFLKQRQERLDRQVLKLAQTLIRNHYKVTGPRLEIIEAITTFDNTFSIEELHDKLIGRAKARGKTAPGIASVFRAVKLLTEELSLLQRVHSGDGCHRYGLQRGHQHQVVCRCCERTLEFEGCDFEELTRFLENKTGFQLEGHWMEFFGLCTLCRQAQPGPLNPGLKVNSLLPHDHSRENPGPARSEPLDVREVSQSPA